MAVHPAAALVEQDRSDVAAGDAAVHGSGYGGWHGHEHSLVSVAYDTHDSMSVLFAEVADVQARGLEDPQSE